MSTGGSREWEILSSLVESVQAAEDLSDAADAVVGMAKVNLECDYAGITVQERKGHLKSLAVTDPIVHEADLLQYALREGPCVDALWELRDYAVDDVATDPRWPRWGPQAAALGLSSLLAVRMSSSDGRIGALNLYSSRKRVFTDDEIAFAHVFGHHAAVALSSARIIGELTVAVDGRTLVGQAQGILMERFELNPAQAFAVLRRYSQEGNVKLREVAEAVVTTGQLPPMPDPVREPVREPAAEPADAPQQPGSPAV